MRIEDGRNTYLVADLLPKPGSEMEPQRLRIEVNGYAIDYGMDPDFPDHRGLWLFSNDVKKRKKFWYKLNQPHNCYLQFSRPARFAVGNFLILHCLVSQQGLGEDISEDIDGKLACTMTVQEIYQHERCRGAFSLKNTFKNKDFFITTLSSYDDKHCKLKQSIKNLTWREAESLEFELNKEVTVT